MTSLTRKLNSARGASIFIGLLFFLLCAMVGAVVLTAAMANAGRLTDLRAQQQAYLDVRSAARLLRDEVEGQVFTATRTVIQNNDPRIENGPLITDDTVYSPAPDCYLGDLLKSDASTICGEKGGTAQPDGHTLALSGVAGMAAGMGDVTGTWVMKQGDWATKQDVCLITVNLAQTADEDSETDISNPVTLTIPAYVNTVKTETIATDSYPTGRFIEDDDGNSIEIWENFTIVTTTYITTVTWHDGDIDKSVKEAGTDAQS